MGKIRERTVHLSRGWQIWAQVDADQHHLSLEIKNDDGSPIHEIQMDEGDAVINYRLTTSKIEDAKKRKTKGEKP